MELSSLKVQYEGREREWERESKRRQEVIQEKELELVSKGDAWEREKKNVSDLEKALQGKQYEMDKLLQNERNNAKSKFEEQKSKIDGLEKELFKMEQEKEDQAKDIEQFKATIIRMDY